MRPGFISESRKSQHRQEDDDIQEGFHGYIP